MLVSNGCILSDSLIQHSKKDKDLIDFGQRTDQWFGREVEMRGGSDYKKYSIILEGDGTVLNLDYDDVYLNLYVL